MRWEQTMHYINGLCVQSKFGIWFCLPILCRLNPVTTRVHKRPRPPINRSCMQARNPSSSPRVTSPNGRDERFDDTARGGQKNTVHTPTLKQWRWIRVLAFSEQGVWWNEYNSLGIEQNLIPAGTVTTKSEGTTELNFYQFLTINIVIKAIELDGGKRRRTTG